MATQGLIDIGFNIRSIAVAKNRHVSSNTGHSTSYICSKLIAHPVSVLCYAIIPSSQTNKDSYTRTRLSEIGPISSLLVNAVWFPRIVTSGTLPSLSPQSYDSIESSSSLSSLHPLPMVPKHGPLRGN